MIRHGQNDMVGKHLVGRQSDVHLNDQGRSQAKQLAADLAGLPIKAVFASPLERAQETAAPIAHFHNLPVITEEGLIEMDFGQWQSRSIAELKQSPLWEIIQESPNGFCFPEGETFNAAQARIAKTLQSINRAYAENDLIVCVSHCDPIRLAIAYFLGLPLNAFQRLRVDTASVSMLHLKNGNVSLNALNMLKEYSGYLK